MVLTNETLRIGLETHAAQKQRRRPQGEVDSLGLASSALRKHEPSVDHYPAVLAADQHAIHADLAQAANGQHAQRRALIGRRTGERLATATKP